MAGYWIAHVTIADEAAYARYAALAEAAIESHGGEFLARGGPHRQMEGRDHARNVVVRFASLDEAVACYESPDYQAALVHAQGAADRDLVLVEGI